jgi:hypothetical protein
MTSPLHYALGDFAMTIPEIAILSVLIAAVVVSVWLGFLHRKF